MMIILLVLCCCCERRSHNLSHLRSQISNCLESERSQHSPSSVTQATLCNNMKIKMPALLYALVATNMVSTVVSQFPEAMDRSLQAPEDCDTCYNLTAGDGNEFYLYPQWLNNSRNFIYCEMIWNYDDQHGSDIYSTSPIQPCNVTWWDDLNLTDVADSLDAESATKNGPQYWSMDQVRVYASDPVDIFGEPMVFGAVLPPGTVGMSPYTVFYPSKNQYLVWNAGKPTYRLTDNDGYVYVLQGYKVPESELATLGDDFQDLPEGWTYTVVNPDEDLIMDLTPDIEIPSVQDEFDQVYIRITNETVPSTSSPDAPTSPTDAPTSAGVSTSYAIYFAVTALATTWFV
jgi:hypothetical protein